MIYLVLVIIAAVSIGAAYCATAKPGEKDGISKYGNSEDHEK